MVHRLIANLSIQICLALASYNFATTVLATAEPSLIVKYLNFDRGKFITTLEGTKDGFTFRTNDVQLKLTDNALECLAHLRFEGQLEAEKTMSSDSSQWILWKLDMFNPADEKFWIPSPISNCGRSTDHFLGGPCQLSTGRVQRYYTAIPDHKELRITGRAHFFDQWNGETLNLKVDNDVVWSEAYNWCPTVDDSVCRKYRIDLCGQEYPDRLSVLIDVSLPHKSDKVALEFNSTLKVNPCEASWGIDDVAIYIR